MNGIRFRMGGKGVWRDYVLIERLWRSMKCEEVWLNAYRSMQYAKTRLKSWIEFYSRDGKPQTLETTSNKMCGNVEGLKLEA